MRELKLNYEGKEYRLTYTRETVRRMENLGFEASAIESKPMTMIPLLVEGAFWANHTGIKRKVSEEIFSNIKKDRDDFLAALMNMYIDTVRPLLNDSDDDADDNGKNVQWEMTE